MNKQELLNKYARITETWMDKQAKLDNVIDRWLNGEINMESEMLEQLVKSVHDQVEQLKSAANLIHEEYLKVAYEEAKVNNSVKTPLPLVKPNGIMKTPEELALERDNLLNDLKIKVMTREVSIEEAFLLAQEINTAYGYNTEVTKR